MFSGCPSVCACVYNYVAGRGHSPTGLPSTSGFNFSLELREQQLS